MSSKNEKGRKPELLCIGAQKAGTSWLHETLGEHPQIWTPPFKELHFFDHKFVEECRRWTPWHVRKSVNKLIAREKAASLSQNTDFLAYLEQIKTKPMFNGNWYKSIFAPAPETSICLDVTPEYSTIPQEGVEFATRFLNKAKFIYIIRAPLSRALSQLRMNVSRAKQPPASIDAWIEHASNPVILHRGDYSTYVPRWAQAAGKDRIKFMPYRRINTDSSGFLAELEQFAGLPSHSYRNAHRRIHVTKDVAVPEACVEYLRDRTDQQDRFLKEYFGVDFHRMT